MDTICGISCATQRAPGIAIAADHVQHARREELGCDLGQQ
jgi:hypothetical protein